MTKFDQGAQEGVPNVKPVKTKISSQPLGSAMAAATVLRRGRPLLASGPLHASGSFLTNLMVRLRHCTVHLSCNHT